MDLPASDRGARYSDRWGAGLDGPESPSLDP